MSMQADANRRHYEKRLVRAHYAKRQGLHADEAAILQRFRHDIAGRRILDVGVGGGRTTEFLAELGSRYVGIDYSREMVEECRRRFPRATFRLVDARDLSIFDEGSFDFVFFSNNGIDAVGHDDRLSILSGVRRILAPGGLFVFSTHNRNFETPKAWDIRHLWVNPLREPIGFAKRLASFPVGILNYLRRARLDETHEEYSIFVDSAHSYALTHYRITAAAQKLQLERLGFCDIEAIGFDGRQISCRQSGTIADPWINYACRREPAAEQLATRARTSLHDGKAGLPIEKMPAAATSRATELASPIGGR
jgi:SAM-dependent methyltransferase